MERYINPEKIKLDSITWLDGDSDILVPLVDVKKAIAQTPTEDVVLRAELAVQSLRDAATIHTLEEKLRDLKCINSILVSELSKAREEIAFMKRAEELDKISKW